MRPQDYEFSTLTSQQRTLNKSHTLGTNKAENIWYEICNATDCRNEKMLPNEHFNLRLKLEKNRV